MGDRANVVIKSEGENDLFLYTHSGGYNLPTVVQHALQRGVRWEDDAYLARIIFCEMIKGRESEETGYGISTYEIDSERPTIFIDCRYQHVTIHGYSYPFKDFCEIDTVDIMKIWEEEK